MTGRELIDQILKLGLKSQVVYPVEPEAIYVHCNRAIEEVNRLCPVADTVTILNFPLTPTEYRKGITVHRGGEDLTIDASGVESLAFAVSGTGEAILQAEGQRDEHVFKWTDVASFKVLRAVILTVFGEEHANVKLTFTGKFSYMIKDLSFYSEMKGDVEEDIVPYSSTVSYDIAAEGYAGVRFMDFASLPVRYNDVDLNAPTDYRLEGSRIYLPANKQGVYEVHYFKRPLTLNADNLDEDIEIDERFVDLMPLRAAYYHYMLTDSEVADRCNQEYLRMQNVIMATVHKVRTPVRFRNARGW